MKNILMLLMTLLISSCHSTHTLKNTLPMSNIDTCLILSSSQKDDAYVMKYYGVNRDQDGEIFYHYRISDYFNLIQNNFCTSSKKAIIDGIRVTTKIKSTSGPKGETVGIFNFRVETSLVRNDRESLNKNYEFEIRSEPYNWERQKAILEIFDKTFSKGMKKIETSIISDLEQL